MKAFLNILLAVPLLVMAGEKIISVPYTKEAPVIDGRITEKCWTPAESYTDFLRPGTQAAAIDPVKVKMLFNEKGIYAAFQCRLSEPEVLANVLKEMTPKYQAGNRPAMKGFYGRYRIELFFDVNGSGTVANSYQILINSLNQYSGHRGGNWSIFDIPVETCATLENDIWSIEMFFGFKDIKVGDAWGFNLCVEQMQSTALWNNTDGFYFNPRKFGQIIFGSYRDWSETVLKNADIELERLKPSENHSLLYEKFYKNAVMQRSEIGKSRIVNLTDFLRFSKQYKELSNLLNRMRQFEDINKI